MHRCEGCGQKCVCDGDDHDWYAAPVDCECDHGREISASDREQMKKLAADALRRYVKSV